MPVPPYPRAQAKPQDDYAQFRDFLEQACGISLGDNKHYLVNSRLGRLMNELGMATLGEFVARLKRDPSPALRRRTIDAMTTNETQWFRDVHPFTVLREVVLAELGGSPGPPLRVWSAGCSSGQEPYSISMVVDEYRSQNVGRMKREVEIVATDISTNVLALARRGVYDDMALARGLSGERKRRYFTDVDGGWQVRDGVRARVTFRDMNLLDSFAALGRVDAVFCRNVLIYFSQDRKIDIIGRMARSLNPRGFLFLGASESLAGNAELFEVVRFGTGLAYRVR